MKKSLLFGILGVSCVIISMGMIALWQIFQPASSNAETVKFIIKKGESLSSIAQMLEEEGLLRSSLSLRILARGNETTIHPGSVEISASMKPSEILSLLISDTQDVWVTLKEGLRREEVAEELERRLRSFDTDEFLSLTEGKEGQLFPDTYLFPKEATPAYVVSVLNRTFGKRFEEALEGINQKEEDLSTVITMASILEREARSLEDMRLVAGILYHRLEIGMPLQVDATLQFIKGKDKVTGSWWSIPKAQDKQLPGPFNTYKHRGMPPSPICNPGLNAIKAALDPIETRDLYYITDRTGMMRTAQTLDQHNENIARYLK